MFARRDMSARRSKRVRTVATGSCKTGRGFQWDVEFCDLSAEGCCVMDPRADMPLGSLVTVFIEGTGPHLAEVAWRQGDRVGLQFARSLPPRLFQHLAAEEWDEALELSFSTKPGDRVRRFI